MRLVLALVCVATVPIAPALAQSAALPLKRTPTPTTAEITARDVMTRTYVIADDSMEGRDTGKRGGLRSANYIAAELKRLGLEPAQVRAAPEEQIVRLDAARAPCDSGSAGERHLQR